MRSASRVLASGPRNSPSHNGARIATNKTRPMAHPFGHYWEPALRRPLPARGNRWRTPILSREAALWLPTRFISDRGIASSQQERSSMSKLTTWTICVALSAALVQPVFAADNELTPEEKAAGWQLLFNGNDYSGWRCNNGREIASKIEDHCLVPHKSGGYLIIYEKEFGDFVLTCDVKMDPVCNSGVFVRVGNPKDPVQTGFEVQVASEIGTGKHDFGALV